MYGFESEITKFDMNKGSKSSGELVTETINGAMYLKMVDSVSSEQYAMRLKADLMVEGLQKRCIRENNDAMDHKSSSVQVFSPANLKKHLRNTYGKDGTLTRST